VGLRTRTLGPPLLIVSFLIMATGWFGVERVLSRFAVLEAWQMERSGKRARHVLEDRATDLEFKGRDWARWDDAATWLEGRNPSFPGSNLEDSTLSNMGQDQLFFWDGRLGPRAGLGRSGFPDAALEKALRKMAKPGVPVRTGLVRAGPSLYLATLQQVFHASGAGRSPGWFALARRMDAREELSLDRVLQTPATFRIGSDRPLAVPVGSEQDSSILSIPLPLLDTGTAKLEIRLDRPLHKLGLEAARGFLFQYALSVLAAVAAALFMMERLVLRRIARIADGVERIGESETTSIRVADPRQDEIGNLSRRIDAMVDRLDRARAQLQVALGNAETAAHARSHFLASVTHELRTPLNGVIGLTEQVLKGRLDVEQREALELSRGAALGLLDTINGVLEYSRLEKGNVELVLDDADLSGVVMDVAKLLAPIAADKEVDLLAPCDPRIPRLLKVDSGRMRQILNNLVGNAVKFTSEGRVVVSVRLADPVDGPGSDGYFARIRFEISDTGVGIPADRQEAIFEPFQQSSAETAIRFGGTGLGLTIARDLVRAMGGTIEVESLPGRGSRFRFEVQLAVADATPIASGLPEIGGGVRAELTDPVQRDLVLDLLRTAGVPEGDGVLVTDSVESALSSEGPVVVVVRPSLVRSARVLLGGAKATVLSHPFDVPTLFKALEKAARPMATILVAATGRIQREVVRGMLEREGMRVLAPIRVEDAGLAMGISPVDLAVVDLDDPDWDSVDLDGIPVVWIGDPRDDRPGPVLAKPVRANDLMRIVLRALANGRAG
jgi:signal transduction histidine kinase/CheY-like chemotaxis protein